MTAGQDCIVFLPARKDGRATTFGEIRAVASDYRDAAWEQDERAIGAIAISVRVERRKVDVRVWPAFQVSDHALGRRLQREPSCTILQALNDAIDALPWATACWQQQPLGAPSQPTILVPTATGHWRGYLARFDLPEGVELLPMLRSWLPDETIEDAKFLRALAVLRQGHPAELDDTAQAALRLALKAIAR